MHWFRNWSQARKRQGYPPLQTPSHFVFISSTGICTALKYCTVWTTWRITWTIAYQSNENKKYENECIVHPHNSKSKGNPRIRRKTPEHQPFLTKGRNQPVSCLQGWEPCGTTLRIEPGRHVDRQRHHSATVWWGSRPDLCNINALSDRNGT